MKLAALQEGSYKNEVQLGRAMSEDQNSLERLQRLRGLAADALQLARRAKSPEVQREYENLAAAWAELIAELERLETKSTSRAH